MQYIKARAFLARWKIGNDDYTDKTDYLCKKRYLGGSGTFTTKDFKPVLNTGEAADIRYWDASSNSYIDIGSQISGTEYDAAHVILGGKWRMPTKEEMDELLACETKTHIKDQTIEKFTIVGPSGNSIDFFNMYYWTGNMGEDNKPWEMTGLGLPESGHHITSLFSPRERALLIRPVCDY